MLRSKVITPLALLITAVAALGWWFTISQDTTAPPAPRGEEVRQQLPGQLAMAGFVMKSTEEQPAGSLRLHWQTWEVRKCPPWNTDPCVPPPPGLDDRITIKLTDIGHEYSFDIERIDFGPGKPYGTFWCAPRGPAPLTQILADAQATRRGIDNGNLQPEPYNEASQPDTYRYIAEHCDCQMHE